MAEAICGLCFIVKYHEVARGAGVLLTVLVFGATAGCPTAGC